MIDCNSGAAVRSVFLSALLVASAAARQAEDLAAPNARAGQREVSMLQLFDGAILWGSIVGHDAQTLHIERLDNGGRVRLPWTQLAPALSEQLLDQYGYVDRSGEEVVIEAERFILRDGREVVGVTINQTFDAFWVKTATSAFAVPKLQIKVPPTRVKVNALEIYTREELYKAESASLEAVLAAPERSAAEKAKAHWDLASYCERIYDFTHAVEHFGAAKALAPEFKTAEVAAALERNTAKVALQSQLDALREIDTLRARGRFDDAVRKADAFIASHEDSPLRVDAAKKKTQVIKAREQKMRERVADAWLRWLPRLIERKARTPALTLEAGLDYIDQALRAELVESVSSEVSKTVSAEATPELVKRYWSERKPARWRSASYGQGTWLLGEAEARKGLDEEKEEAPQSETDAARKELEERIKRYLQNQEMVRKAQSPDAKSEEEDREKFWAEYSSSSKALWLLARHVETSGEYQLRDPSFTNCPDCGGRGVRETVSVRGTLNAGNNQGGGQRQIGGEISLSKCPTCYHIGVFRKVWYR